MVHSGVQFGSPARGAGVLAPPALTVVLAIVAVLIAYGT